ncbi:cyclic AMP-responsive element-binding protein 3-like protein 4 [Siphateles boraxobius]|uniref:cyclic AMP-responsive element-binding protein 3-like protein 4 n=1 Tax=Siphateles boraxobius TaxID=180520 RepID=UPI004064A5BB
MREPDIGSEDVKYTERDAEEAVESGLILDDGVLYSEDWSVEPRCSLNDSESEEVLNAINPNEMYTSALSESDSGLSEDQSDEQNHSVYQVVYDISGVGGASAEQQSPHMISIELDEWSSQMLLSESCVVNELVSSVKVENISTHDMQNKHNPDSFLVYPDLQLTDEEQKLLDQEGISLPNNLPLTKAEERILKKVRRKIRNKLSAQDSRKRKKEYIDGLESRVAACSAQNKELQRTVNQLEKHNMSLMAQLHKLQALIKQTATKAAQTSTCILILFFSLALLIFPSYSPFSRSSSSLEESYAPSGVLSRNILNDAGSLALLEDPLVPDPTELKLSDSDWPSDVQSQSQAEEQSNGTNADTLLSLSAPADADTLLSVSLTAPANADAVAATQTHADEM